MTLSGRGRFASAVLAVFLTWSAEAFAEPSTAPSPPIPQSSTDVPYPAGAKGDAVVELELVIEKDGTVSHAAVMAGEEPFADQAERAVLTWRFIPAHRGAVPVAVRTRARVVFHQDSGDAPSSPDPPPASAASSRLPLAPAAATPAAASTSPDEVTVRGKRHEIGQTTLSATDVREMPGAFGDPFRAVDALPSVTPMVSGLPYFFIRGAPPSNNGYFLDGIRVPLLFHVALGPGVIHPSLVDRIDFYPGAAPASYGRFAGAVIAGQTKEPATTFHGAANLRLVDAGALLESPFADGRGTALIAGRYGYPGPVVGAFSDVKLGYWDYQSRVAWRLGDRDTVSVFAFGSHDYLAHRAENGTEIEDFVSDFHRVDVRYDHALVDGRARVAATVGWDSQGASPSYLTNTSMAVRMEIERKLSPTVRVRGGADARRDAYGFEEHEPPDPSEPPVPSNVAPPPTNIAWGAHADVVWRLAPRVEIVPGVRVDVFESSRDRTPREASTRVPSIDPRLAARVTLTPSVAWLSTFGLSHQYPTLRVGSVPAAVLTGSGFPAGSSRLQTVAQASQGVEVALPSEIVLTATGFLSGWSGLTDLTASCIQIMPATEPPGPGPTEPVPTPYTCPSSASVHGRAYGFELLVRRPLSKRLSGWLSYTLSRSLREAHFITPQGGDAVATVLSDFDRPHVLNAILAYDLGRRWRAGSRFVFYSGTPYSPLSGNVPVPPYNSMRDPPFFRLDVRLEKRWPLGKTGSIAFVFEGQNVTLSKEASGLGLDCIGEFTTEKGGTTKCTRSMVGPITIPSVGVEAFF
jgi:TonB dependent receptor/TonB-dependent Receptor Plug Domain/Gram-negative bacterial TonB protein C-terminal